MRFDEPQRNRKEERSRMVSYARVQSEEGGFTRRGNDLDALTPREGVCADDSCDVSDRFGPPGSCDVK